MSVFPAFAVLGSRPLYFVIAGMIRRFVYLQAGLSVVLVFVGASLDPCLPLEDPRAGTRGGTGC